MGLVWLYIPVVESVDPPIGWGPAGYSGIQQISATRQETCYRTVYTCACADIGILIFVVPSRDRLIIDVT